MDPDDLMMLALDAGAEDFSEEEDSFEVITDPDAFSQVRQVLESEGIVMAQAEVTMIPQTHIAQTAVVGRIRTALLDRNRNLTADYGKYLQGCVSYMFDKKGQIIIDREECGMDPDDLMMLALDSVNS